MLYNIQQPCQNMEYALAYIFYIEYLCASFILLNLNDLNYEHLSNHRGSRFPRN